MNANEVMQADNADAGAEVTNADLADADSCLRIIPLCFTCVIL